MSTHVHQSSAIRITIAIGVFQSVADLQTMANKVLLWGIAGNILTYSAIGQFTSRTNAGFSLELGMTYVLHWAVCVL